MNVIERIEPIQNQLSELIRALKVEKVGKRDQLGFTQAIDAIATAYGNLAVAEAALMNTYLKAGGGI